MTWTEGRWKKSMPWSKRHVNKENEVGSCERQYGILVSTQMPTDAWLIISDTIQSLYQFIENHSLNQLRSTGSNPVGTATSVPYSIIYRNQRGPTLRCQKNRISEFGSFVYVVRTFQHVNLGEYPFTPSAYFEVAACCTNSTSQVITTCWDGILA